MKRIVLFLFTGACTTATLPARGFAVEAITHDAALANPVVHHAELRAETSSTICSASETPWVSRVADHDTLLVCLPKGWNGAGDVDGQLAVSSPFGPTHIGPDAQFFYHGQTTVVVHGDPASSAITIDVPLLAMTGMGLGSATELSGGKLDVRAAGTLVLRR